MRSILAIVIAAVVFFPQMANATDVWGDQWGTWTKENSPYNVIGEIRVPPESTLVIEPGVVVNFQGHYKFIVDSLATLLAVGSETDSIKFTVEDQDSGWHGIRFIYADGNSELSYCWLEYGNATGSWPDNCGGAIYCSNSSPKISNSTLFGNTAADRGAGIYSEFSSPVIAFNTISANSASLGGGGVFCRESGGAISDNTFTYNSAQWGGGIYCADSDPVISGNYMRSNGAQSGGGIYCWRSSPTIRANTVSRNLVILHGGGIYCGDQSHPTIADNIISDNDGDGIYCEESAPTIANNTIEENRRSGIHCYQYSSPVIRNNTIRQNFSVDLGGGICCRYHSSPTVMNNIISGNTAEEGGGILCTNFCDPAISNNTITANLADSGGGIGCKYYSDATITNTILWGDAAPEGPEIYVYNSDPRVTYCDVQGGWPGEGNIDLDPLFRDPDGDDFHLMADYCSDPYNSPCIDVGHPDSLDALLDCFHGLGADRADMGAYGGRNSGWRTGVEDQYSPPIPKQFLLHQNYPNPFNATTVIEYQLPVHGYVKLEICNILGQKVVTLVDERRQGGYRSVIWDASDVSSGLYFYKLTAGNFTETKRMTLLK